MKHLQSEVRTRVFGCFLDGLLLMCLDAFGLMQSASISRSAVVEQLLV